MLCSSIGSSIQRKFSFFEALRQLQRFQAGVVVERVEHQRVVRPDGLADGGARFEVVLDAWRAGSGGCQVWSLKAG